MSDDDGNAREARARRLAFIVSHPIQYFAPLHQRLARRSDLAMKVFFTWHDGQAPVLDRGFGTAIKWDIPLTCGYAHELVPNSSRKPDARWFAGLRNLSLVERVAAWRPDAVHVTGWSWLSHLHAMRGLSKRNVPVLFRGDSHLLDGNTYGPRWWIKHAALTRIFRWPRAFLVAGNANRAYYRTFGVPAGRLHACPPSIDVARFAEPAERHESAAREWRRKLDIADGQRVLLFAGKFERRKQPLELMRAVRNLSRPDIVLLMVGSGELESEVKAIAAADPSRFRVLPFQNQSRMPVVYRLGDLFMLPSAYGESWGLAVNEAMACGRPVLASDRVGCAADVIDESCGRVFRWDSVDDLSRAIIDMTRNSARLAEMGRAATRRAHSFDLGRTEDALLDCMNGICRP